MDGDSSDEDLGPAPAPLYANAGFDSIQEMAAHAFEDRISSKKRSKFLQDTRGASVTVYAHSLWKARFDAFRSMGSYRQEGPPTGEMLERFASVITEQIKSCQRDKPMPSYNTVKNSLAALIASLKFHHPDFTLSPHNAARIDTIMDNLQKESKLFKGYWRKTQWVEHALLERMAKAWIKDALNNGCRSWDMRLARLLSVVLVSALNRRSGDIAQSYRYKGAKYLTWADVTLKLERGPEIKNLVAKFTLRHTKGFKTTVNEDEEIILEPYQSPSLRVVCPIKLLLVHALRTGALAGPTMRNTLDLAWARADKSVKWARGSELVLPRFHLNGVLDTSRPASQAQLQASLVAMEQVASILVDLRMTDVRRGLARNLAHLPESIKVANPGVAAALGHKKRSFNKGVTDRYVGPIQQALNVLKAAHLPENCFESSLQRIILEEIDTACWKQE